MYIVLYSLFRSYRYGFTCGLIGELRMNGARIRLTNTIYQLVPTLGSDVSEISTTGSGCCILGSRPIREGGSLRTLNTR